jgi:hypothetical protein
MTSAQNGWRVTSQTETTEQDGTGQIKTGYRIYFTTTGGQTGSVFVPMAQYTNVDVVRQLLSDQVGAVTTIANLSG